MNRWSPFSVVPNAFVVMSHGLSRGWSTLLLKDPNLGNIRRHRGNVEISFHSHVLGCQKFDDVILVDTASYSPLLCFVIFILYLSEALMTSQNISEFQVLSQPRFSTNTQYTIWMSFLIWSLPSWHFVLWFALRLLKEVLVWHFSNIGKLQEVIWWYVRWVPNQSCSLGIFLVSDTRQCHSMYISMMQPGSFSGMSPNTVNLTLMMSL